MVRIGKCFFDFLDLSLSFGLFASAILFWAQALRAQPDTKKEFEVSATIDQQSLVVGDTFTFTISVKSSEPIELGEPRLPDIEGLELINSWNGSEVRRDFSTGSFATTRVQTFNYMLSPLRQGEIKIGSARLVVEGKEVSTTPITLKVEAEGSQQARRQRQPQPLDLFDDADDLFNQLLQRRLPGFRTQPVNPEEAFFIQVEVDKKEAFVNEQVTASWYLYTRGQIRDLDTLQYPAVNGFWKEEIDMATRLNFEQEVIDGVAYKKALLASYALFPLNPGKVIVDEYKAKCTVITPQNFGFGRAYQFTKSSQPIPIRVKPLPEEGRPASFSGAVGKFQVTTKLSSNIAQVNQPLTWTIQFEGRGNAKLIDLPPFQLGEGVEVYDTKEESQFFKTGLSYKTFEILMIPREPGKLIIPEVESYVFQPESETFVAISGQGFELEVLPAASEDSDNLSRPLMISESTDNTIIMPPVFLNWRPEPWMAQGNRRSMVWGVGFSALIAVLAFLFLRVRQPFAQAQLRDLIELRLKKMDDLIGQTPPNFRAFGKEGTNLVYFVLGQLAEEGGASKEIDQVLLKVSPSVRRELSEDLKKLLTEFEWLSFAPVEVSTIKSEINALKKLQKRTGDILLQAIQLAQK